MSDNTNRTIKDAFTVSLKNTVENSSVGTSIALAKSLKQDFSTLSNQINLLGLDIKSIFIDENQYSELINASGNAALSYLNSKIDRIKDAWTTKVNVPIKSLIGEVAPYVTNFKDASKLLVNKIDDLTAYILGVNTGNGDGWGNFVDSLGQDFVNYISNDSSLIGAVSGLGVVKTFANIFNVYQTSSEIIEKVLQIVEPVIPSLEIVTNLVLSFHTCGASTTEASTKITDLAQHYCQQLLSLALQAVRKYVYSIKIPIPALFVGALNSISVREAMLSIDDADDWLKAIFSEDFYNTTMYSLQWEDSINQALHTTLGSLNETVNNWKNFNFVNLKGEPITRGEFMKSKFMTSLTQNFMRKAVAQARKTAYIQSFSNTSWQTKKTYLISSGKFEENSEIEQLTENENVKTKLDILLEDDREISPLRDLESLRIISGQLIANL